MVNHNALDTQKLLLVRIEKYHSSVSDIKLYAKIRCDYSVTFECASKIYIGARALQMNGFADQLRMRDPLSRTAIPQKAFNWGLRPHTLTKDRGVVTYKKTFGETKPRVIDPDNPGDHDGHDNGEDELQNDQAYRRRLPPYKDVVERASSAAKEAGLKPATLGRQNDVNLQNFQYAPPKDQEMTANGAVGQLQLTETQYDAPDQETVTNTNDEYTASPSGVLLTPSKQNKSKPSRVQLMEWDKQAQKFKPSARIKAGTKKLIPRQLSLATADKSLRSTASWEVTSALPADETNREEQFMDDDTHIQKKRLVDGSDPVEVSSWDASANRTPTKQ